MSRLGKKPIIISPEVEVSLTDGALRFKGKEGELTLPVLPFIKAILEEGRLSFSTDGQDKQAKANWGTMVALSKNAIIGVSKKFEKTLKMEGVGFRASVEGKKIVLKVGFSHPVNFDFPEGIDIKVDKNFIKISGVNRELVGQVAAQIRKVKKPEPYKGKGIMYEDEIIRRKSGKKAAGTTAQ